MRFQAVLRILSPPRQVEDTLGDLEELDNDDDNVPDLEDGEDEELLDSALDEDNGDDEQDLEAIEREVSIQFGQSDAAQRVRSHKLSPALL